MIVAGVGCKRGTPAPDIEAAIRAALARANLEIAVLDAVATTTAKAAEPGIGGAAARLGVSIVLVSDADLKAAGARTETRSARVLALTGAPSLAEAAALAAAGSSAHLIGPRLVLGTATCALAVSGAAP